MSICAVCGEPGTKKCSKCKAREYCGLDCQKKDWETHKLNCVKVETKTEEINEKDENNKTPEKTPNNDNLKPDIYDLMLCNKPDATQKKNPMRSKHDFPRNFTSIFQRRRYSIYQIVVEIKRQ